MKRSAILVFTLFLVLPIVSAQEITNARLTVEQIGVASSYGTIAMLTFLILVLLAVTAYLVRQVWNNHHIVPKVKARIVEKEYKPKSSTTYSMEHIIIEDGVEKHLKEDERVLVRLLRQREGQCEQGTLLVISGYSKATLSRLLAELEERGIVRKQRKGRKNIVHIRI